MQCPQYALKCNKGVHLSASLSFLCVLGDLVIIWAGSALVENNPKDIRKTVKRVSEHFYCILVHIQDIA